VLRHNLPGGVERGINRSSAALCVPTTDSRLRRKPEPPPRLSQSSRWSASCRPPSRSPDTSCGPSSGWHPSTPSSRATVSRRRGREDLQRLRLGSRGSFGNPETTTGGNALKFYASVRLDIRATVEIGCDSMPHVYCNAAATAAGI